MPVDNGIRKDREFITIEVLRSHHIREKIALFADNENISFDEAIRILLNDGLKQHGMSLYEDIPSQDATHVMVDVNHITTDVSIRLTYGERVRLEELIEERGYDSAKAFYSDVLTRLRGSRALRLEYRKFLKGEYAILSGGASRIMTVALPVKVTRRIDTLKLCTGNNEADLFRLVLYIDLDEMLHKNGAESGDDVNEG